MKHKVLIVDDEPEYAWLISDFLKSKGFETLLAETARQGLEMIESKRPDIVLLDINLPDLSGVQAVKEIRSVHEDLPVIMISALGEMKTVVEAMQSGATDYLHKPLPSFEEVSQKINTYLKAQTRLTDDPSTKRRDKFQSFIGESANIRQLIREIAKLSPSDTTVLLCGESGSGKNLVAELIHQNSLRKDKPYLVVNCAAFSPDILAIEIFGRENYAQNPPLRKGKLEQAHTGTIFLDEISELTPELQAKILRVLQSGEFERVGGTKTFKADVRVIAATNRDLEDLIEQKHFRQDLFYRLNVPIRIPSLKDRVQDIPLLIHHFLNIENEKKHKRFNNLTDAVMNELVRYTWPGNVRELQNVIERAVDIGREPHLKLSDFHLQLPPERSQAENTSLRDIEHQVLMQSLEKNSGNISKTAKALGISRETIYRRLRKHGVELK